jgi:hypothetical protein
MGQIPFFALEANAAYEAFEALLSAIEGHEDPGDPRFTAFVLAATCAANGREAVLFALTWWSPAMYLRGPLRYFAARTSDSETSARPVTCVAR